MKIGILTFHCAHNYGAMLQTYATHELLRRKGFDAEVIDYRPSYLVDPYKWFSLSRIRKADGTFSIIHLFAEIILLPLRYIRYRRFDNFMSNRLILSPEVTFESFRGDYDVIIVGSDQVWNIRQTGGHLDRMYVADYLFEKGARKYIADAVSLEQELYGADDIECMVSALKRFDVISAREKELAQWLKNLSGLNCTHIPDPVFQIEPYVWHTLAKDPRIDKPYLLVYSLRDHRKVTSFVEMLARNLGLEVVEILSSPDAGKLFRGRQTVSVEEFLGLFAHASFVVTTSFHGTAFSLIFKRLFYSFVFGDSKDSRVRSLLDSLDLTDRMLQLDSDVIDAGTIDYDPVSLKMDQMRRSASDFLLKSISDVNASSDSGQEKV